MRRLGTLVIAAAVVLSACAGGDDDTADRPRDVPDTVEHYTTTLPAEGLAFTDWQKATRAVCVRYEPRLAAVGLRLEGTTTPAEAGAALQEIFTLVDEYIDALKVAPVPTQRTREVEEVEAGLDRFRQGFESLRASVVRGDLSGAQATAGWVDNYSNLDELFTQLDLPECNGDDGA